MKDWFEAGAIPQVDVKTPCDEFENLIRKVGVGFACEWFGYDQDTDFSMDAVNELCDRSGIEKPFLVNSFGRHMQLNDENETK